MNELLDYIEQKKHDENRQGEALNLALNESEFKNNKHFYIESYGCAMNFSDSEIVASILAKQGYGITTNIFDADLILVNTCSIREKAEQTVRQRLRTFNQIKEQKPSLMVGVLGCMAERLKSKFLEEEKLVDIVVGPDAYRSLPELLHEAEGGQKGINVLLSREETYADISPIRLDKNGITGFISIMRGCDNMCSFCVVPFTRGRERSRNPETIVEEARDLFNRGYREVTLLGQNVDSFKWKGEGKNDDKEAAILVNFAQLLEMVALVNPLLRVRFSTSHPKDITDDVLHTIAKYNNICSYIHLPVQSGSSSCLERMNRTYDRDWYMNRVDAIRRIIPDCGISSDVIAGFCDETEEEHLETLSMMDYAQYDYSYMFYYSERPGTLAARKYTDNVPLETKKRRLAEIVEKQYQLSLQNNLKDIGKTYEVLVEKISKKNEAEYCGRNSQNKMIIFPKGNYNIGDYVNVYIESANKATLKGRVV
ncbi:MAG TPA: tRNA (N6-isopentenyl adenosine(37)-C2)-methylthiotransferase MiaB [Chitinophagales bacterium]|nr:tRNA (N6-isopentenyl adenosine(37)-C2)-methylthiotransferase MiaB [Chitinophagales bacterium]HMX61142.1 tRNA (N6-isopentenyl adenosine(37)-C2)-methylthiotransferase MiaB [Chitinophagales bacterium]HMY24553.1 tRNA (N6-isopentenyl adenosine(37)-C2)-methylthiotransferase MiaB [Chitinophagales bacterium]HMZ34713.1 tRNA (N6-isopentenyl adenosine(37)-C2)-methylthiotransferase MiaB [Chitinophagales bacterium]HNA40348.1 tRNA (N6-isopentenyl adenosine(37)-C2)-methylthiotransferase MiaB [Chitinophagal